MPAHLLSVLTDMQVLRNPVMLQAILLKLSSISFIRKIQLRFMTNPLNVGNKLYFGAVKKKEQRISKVREPQACLTLFRFHCQVIVLGVVWTQPLMDSLLADLSLCEQYNTRAPEMMGITLSSTHYSFYIVIYIFTSSN